jgi:hypothetical protein
MSDVLKRLDTIDLKIEDIYVRLVDLESGG